GVALPRVFAPEVDTILVGRRAMADRLRKQVLDHGVNLALGQEVVAGRRDVLAHFFTGVAVAAFVGVREAIVIGHAGAGPAALHHFGKLLWREMVCRERQRFAAITLVTRCIPFMAILAHRLGLEDLLAELQHPRLFSGGCCLGADRCAAGDGAYAGCDCDYRHAAAGASLHLLQSRTDHSTPPRPVLMLLHRSNTRSGRVRPDPKTPVNTSGPLHRPVAGSPVIRS